MTKIEPGPRPYVFSVAQVARHWNCSIWHVYGLIERGELGHLRIGSLIRIRETDIEAYEGTHSHSPVSRDVAKADATRHREVVREVVATARGVPRDAFEWGQAIAARLGPNLPADRSGARIRKPRPA